jgi:hypothetical protein
MGTLKQIEANRRNSKLSTGPTSLEGRAVIRMNALKSGIDAQSQIITGEDPDDLEHLAAQYYERFQPQGPEEAALIDDAISSDWLLRRLRKTESQLWDRSNTQTAADNRKWGRKAEAYPLAAAFRDQQKVFERLQRRISAAERSLRAALETLARLRKLGGTGLLACQVPEVGQAPEGPSRISPGNPSSIPSKGTPLPEIGFVPESQVGPAILSPANVGEVPQVAFRVPPADPQSPTSHPLVPDPS